MPSSTNAERVTVSRLSTVTPAPSSSSRLTNQLPSSPYAPVTNTERPLHAPVLEQGMARHYRVARLRVPDQEGLARGHVDRRKPSAEIRVQELLQGQGGPDQRRRVPSVLADHDASDLHQRSDPGQPGQHRLVEIDVDIRDYDRPQIIREIVGDDVQLLDRDLVGAGLLRKALTNDRLALGGVSVRPGRIRTRERFVVVEPLKYVEEPEVPGRKLLIRRVVEHHGAATPSEAPYLDDASGQPTSSIKGLGQVDEVLVCADVRDLLVAVEGLFEECGLDRLPRDAVVMHVATDV